MLREPVRCDRIVTILPSGKVGRRHLARAARSSQRLFEGGRARRARLRRAQGAQQDRPHYGQRRPSALHVLDHERERGRDGEPREPPVVTTIIILTYSRHSATPGGTLKSSLSLNKASDSSFRSRCRHKAATAVASP